MNGIRFAFLRHVSFSYGCFGRVRGDPGGCVRFSVAKTLSVQSHHPAGERIFRLPGDAAGWLGCGPARFLSTHLQGRPACFDYDTLKGDKWVANRIFLLSSLAGAEKIKHPRDS